MERWVLRACHAHDGFHGRREQKNDALLEEGGDYSNPFGLMFQKFRQFERLPGRELTCFGRRVLR